MKILGIIVEYNPFHNGHLYHINRSKEITGADYVIAVMSGNYVQRGEPACIDKFTRAKMALIEGVDVVIELPTIFSSLSAEFFAQGAINILNSLNIIDYLCFGSETNDISRLKEIATILVNEPEEYTNKLKLALKEGKSFPKARTLALKKYEDILTSPNNILGIEYLKALLKINSKIEPYVLERVSAQHDSNEIINNITSATNIRKLLKSNDLSKIKDVIPPNLYNILMDATKENKGEIVELNDFSHILQYKLKAMSISEIKNIFGMNEGLENRLIKSSNEKYYINDILERLKTKRYPLTTLQRLLLHTILGITTELVNYKNLYARVLGFRKTSKGLLKILKDYSSIPVITNINKYLKESKDNEITQMLRNEILWTDMYKLANQNSVAKSELCEKIIVV